MYDKVCKNKNPRGHSSHASTHPHSHAALHLPSESSVFFLIVDVSGHPETGHNLTGIDGSSCNATHTWEKVKETRACSDLVTSQGNLMTSERAPESVIGAHKTDVCYLCCLQTFFLIFNPTSHDEHDAGAEAHLGLGGVLHAGHFEASQRQSWNHGPEDAQHHAHRHQGSHGLEGTWKTVNTRGISK